LPRKSRRKNTWSASLQSNLIVLSLEFCQSIRINSLTLMPNISKPFIKLMASPFHFLAAIPPALDLLVQAPDPRRIFCWRANWGLGLYLIV